MLHEMIGSGRYGSSHSQQCILFALFIQLEFLVSAPLENHLSKYDEERNPRCQPDA